MEGEYTHYIYTSDEQVNAVWVMTSAAWIFFMEAGFFLLEAGAQRKKNVASIMIMNLMSAAVALVMWWFTGYAFGFSHNPTGFIG
jgi:Amt family ammonium transporter